MGGSGRGCVQARPQVCCPGHVRHASSGSFGCRSGSWNRGLGRLRGHIGVGHIGGAGGGVLKLGFKSAALGTCAMKPRGLLAAGACFAAGVPKPCGNCSEGPTRTWLRCAAGSAWLRGGWVSAGPAVRSAELGADLLPAERPQRSRGVLWLSMCAPLQGWAGAVHATQKAEVRHAAAA